MSLAILAMAMIAVGLFLSHDKWTVRSDQARRDAESRQRIIARLPILRRRNFDVDAEQERLDESYYWLSWGLVAVGGLMLFFMAVGWALSVA